MVGGDSIVPPACGRGPGLLCCLRGLRPHVRCGGLVAHLLRIVERRSRSFGVRSTEDERPAAMKTAGLGVNNRALTRQGYDRNGQHAGMPAQNSDATDAVRHSH